MEDRGVVAVEPVAPAVTGAWCRGVVPWIGGRPMTEGEARRLASFVLGEDFPDWRATEAREKDSRRKAGWALEAAKTEKRTGECASAFCSMLLRMFPGIPADVLELRLPDGSRVAPDGIVFDDLGRAVRSSASPCGFDGEVPRFGAAG